MIVLGLEHLVLTAGLSGAAGWGLARIKSKATVSAIEAETKKVGGDIETGVKDVAADIKKKL